MGAKTKEVGGGPATGLADNYVNFLQSILNGGSFGAAGSPDAVGTTGGISKMLQDLFSAGGGVAGNNIDAIFSKAQERNVNDLRARFGQSGLANSTSAALGESAYRAEAAPQIGNAITGLQLNALGPLLSSMFGISQKGISQREVVQEPGALSQILGPLAGIGAGAAQFAGGNPFGNKSSGLPSSIQSASDYTSGMISNLPQLQGLYNR